MVYDCEVDFVVVSVSFGSCVTEGSEYVSEPSGVYVAVCAGDVDAVAFDCDCDSVVAGAGIGAV